MHVQIPVHVGAIGVAVALVSAFVAPQAIAGATPGANIRVTSNSDSIASDGRCSLPEAVRSANLDASIGGCAAGRGADVIILGPGTFPLTIAGAAENAALTGDLDFTGQVTIRGAGA